VANLCKTMALSAGCGIVAGMEGLSRGAALGHWALLEALAAGIDAENPAVHAAIRDLLAATAALLSGRGLASERTRRIESPVPILALAAHLGCREAELRRLNSVADSFLVRGEVAYV